uniref:DNA damage-binding protein 1 n=1 Tax=Leersia perrieri TaxID=77586 RepID=A0A0D9V2C3_9ORYZ
MAEAEAAEMEAWEPAPGGARRSWNYVVTAHKPTVVTHSCVGNFTAPDHLNLIVSKCTRIEIYLFTRQGIQPMLDAPVYGRIATIELFRPCNESQDLLFICTERYRYCVLQWDGSKSELLTRSEGNAYDQIGRPTDKGQIGTIDPHCRLVGLHVIPFGSKGHLNEPSNIRLEELLVLDIKFLYGCDRPTIVLLFQDDYDARHVKTYEVALKDNEFVEGPWSQNNLDNGASLLIPVPAPLGVVIVIGEITIAYFSATTFRAVSIKQSMIGAVGLVDPDGSRYLFGDNTGGLHLLTVTHDQGRVTDLKICYMGETSIASTISYVDNGFVYIGSQFGDSQLIRLNIKANARGSFVEVLEQYANIGPIVDFCCVDLGKQGQGAYKDGSIRAVQNGVVITKQASVELRGIKGLWSLKSSSNDPYDTFLVVTFINETHFLSMKMENELEETVIKGFDSQTQTLCCQNAIHDQLIQVTAKSVRLVSSTSKELVAQWLAPEGFSVNVASANASQVGISSGYIDLRENLGGEIVPRSVLLCTIEEVSYLFCALGDRHFFSFLLNASTGELSDKNRVLLGTEPISLHTFAMKDRTHVFAASDRPSVIYGRDKNLLYSHVNLKEVNHVCSFNTSVFPESLAIAEECQLSIQTIDDVHKLRIRTIPLNEQARRICHQEQSRTLALCSFKSYIAAELSEAHFVHLLDHQTLGVLSTHTLDAYECGLSIISCSFSDDNSVYYCVGTAYVLPWNTEPTKLIAEKETKGAVYSLNAFNGKLLAAINQKIRLYKWLLQDNRTHELQEECTYHGNVLALYTQTRGNFIVVGDMMRSISLLVHTHEEGLIEVARDHSPTWMTAIEMLDDEVYIGADNCYNLYTVLKSNDAGITGSLLIIGQYHLGDFVNRFHHGSIVMYDPGSEIGQIPTIIFGTASGAIGVVASLPQDQYMFLEKLQSVLVAYIKSVGNFSHALWRSFYDGRSIGEAQSFVDGDLIESFLSLEPDKMKEVGLIMELPADELCKMVKALRKLHCHEHRIDGR